MMIASRYSFLLIVLVAAVPLPSAAAVSEERVDRHAAQVDAMFAPWRKETTPGAAVLVIREGRIVLKRTYGMADREAKTPITANSAFQLASVSKQFTAMAIMILIDRGKLHYDDTLAQFFPSFARLANPITIRHLLNHTSGLREYDYTLETEAKRATTSSTSRSNPTAEDALRSLEREQNLRFAPGTQYEYNSSNYLVLALIVERVTGERFADFLKKNIFDRLGMRDSSVLDERHIQPRRKVVSYRSTKGGYSKLGGRIGGSIYGDMNVFATLDDLYRWDQALYTERLVRRETLDQAFASGRLNDGTDVGYGFGWQVRDFLGLAALAHSGWALGFRIFILRIPSRQFSVIVLANADDLNANVFAANIAKAYLREQLTYPKEATVPRAAKERFVGTYETREGLFATIALEADDLRLSMSEQKWRMVPESDYKFFLEGREEETVEIKPNLSSYPDSVFLRGNPVLRSTPKAQPGHSDGL